MKPSETKLTQINHRPLYSYWVIILKFKSVITYTIKRYLIKLTHYDSAIQNIAFFLPRFLDLHHISLQPNHNCAKQNSNWYVWTSNHIKHPNFLRNLHPLHLPCTNGTSPIVLREPNCLCFTIVIRLIRLTTIIETTNSTKNNKTSWIS